MARSSKARRSWRARASGTRTRLAPAGRRIWCEGEGMVLAKSMPSMRSQVRQASCSIDFLPPPNFLLLPQWVGSGLLGSAVPRVIRVGGERDAAEAAAAWGPDENHPASGDSGAVGVLRRLLPVVLQIQVFQV